MSAPALKPGGTDADDITMGQRHEFIHGWRSTAGRLLILTLGWLLFAAAAGAVVVGSVRGSTSILAGGFVFGAVARLTSSLAPEPLPGPHKHVRRRIASIARISGHELPT
ncbi:MAG TPA: hypothetical protein VGC47_12115 [Acidimicrobiia bacterium]